MLNSLNGHFIIIEETRIRLDKRSFHSCVRNRVVTEEAERKENKQEYEKSTMRFYRDLGKNKSKGRDKVYTIYYYI